MMLSFTSFEFLLYLAACLGLLHATGKVTLRTWVLITFSYLFYVSFGLAGLAVVTVTGVIDALIGRRLAATSWDGARRRLLWVGIAANLTPLLVLKYTSFAASIAATLFCHVGIRIPVPASPLLSVIGLSYFTFAGISYLVDVYYETTVPAQKLSDFVCYLVYFPKLVAGPIVRAADFLPQLKNGFRVTAKDVEIGCGYLLSGAVKKLVIADQLAPHVGMILAAPQNYNAVTLLQGLVGYTVRIYADFSGYSDMAIGCARLMGIGFPQNFLMPYSSVNIAEFWRRWHVTMSTWFRDYVFLPLEFKSRVTKNESARAPRNIVITMLLCGLWHGASWNFVIWGGIHGVALAIYQTYSRLFPRRRPREKQSAFAPGRLLSRAMTLSVVMLGWIFFGTRNPGVAFTFLGRITAWRQDGVALGSPYIVPLAAVMLITHLLVNKDRNLIEELAGFSTPVRVIAYASLLLTLACLVPSDTVPFAYVRF